MRKFAALTLYIVVSAMANRANAEEFLIGPGSDEESIAKRIAAGDLITLEDGIWRDADLKFERLPGTAEAPVRIRPQTSGKVVFTGRSSFRLSGHHVIVSGFVFRDTDGVSDVVQLRTHSQRLAHDCRVTDCVFEQTSEVDAGTESRWLSVYGSNNRVDHCYFGGKRSRGTTLVVWVGNGLEKHSIDRNYFGPRPKLGQNGGETIRIGTSETSEVICRTVVAGNYFQACDGEAEIVSNKSCENVYRHNVFDRCAGALTLRHGHRCRVDGNVFHGRKKRGTGGVRIVGGGHSITNNYFEGLRGDAERAAVSMMSGVPNGPLNTYAPIRSADLRHNTFVDCKVSMEIAVGSSKRQSAIPADCRVVNNLFVSEKWALLRIHAMPVDFNWEGNKRIGKANEEQPFKIEHVDLPLERATDGLLRPASWEALLVGGATKADQFKLDKDLDDHPRRDKVVVGCDHPGTPFYDWPTALNVGPSFKGSTMQNNELDALP